MKRVCQTDINIVLWRQLGRDTKSARAGADGADGADDGAGGADEDIISPLYPRTETRSVGGRRKETPH